MSVSARLRFEILKRDRFTCAYCGKHPPDVLLEVDHIIPRAAGGGDEESNLLTACGDCNRGKSDRLLEEGRPTVSRQTVDELRERLEQAQAYAELIGQQAALIDQQVQLLNEVWAKAFGATVIERDGHALWQLPNGRFPDERSLRLFVRQIAMHELLAAIDITAARFEAPTSDVCRFFYKICWRRIKGETGPIDGPGPVQHTDWESSFYAMRDERDEMSIRYGRALDRVAELEEEMRDLRRIIESYQDERRTGRMTRLGEFN